jgi:hypothetical protein
MTAPEDAEGLLAWRIELLREAGFSSLLADSLARDTRYDLHGLLELVDRGCPAELAARILAPIDSAPIVPLKPEPTAPLDSQPRPC